MRKRTERVRIRRRSGWQKRRGHFWPQQSQCDYSRSSGQHAGLIQHKLHDRTEFSHTTAAVSHRNRVIWWVNTSNTRWKRLTGQNRAQTHTQAFLSHRFMSSIGKQTLVIPEKGNRTEPLLYDDLGIECSWIKTWLYYISSVSICTENVNKRLLLIFQVVYSWKPSSKIHSVTIHLINTQLNRGFVLNRARYYSKFFFLFTV